MLDAVDGRRAKLYNKKSKIIMAQPMHKLTSYLSNYLNDGRKTIHKYLIK